MADLETIVAERAGVLALSRDYAAAIDRAAGARRFGADEASLVKGIVRSFADAIAQGLHVEGDEAGAREAMRAVVLADQRERADV